MDIRPNAESSKMQCQVNIFDVSPLLQHATQKLEAEERRSCALHVDSTLRPAGLPIFGCPPYPEAAAGHCTSARPHHSHELDVPPRGKYIGERGSLMNRGSNTVPSNAAMIVVDVQNDFCPGGSLAVPRGGEVVKIINGLMDRFPMVVATQDWHPEGHVSFASSHPGRNPFDTIRLGDQMQVLWPDHCVSGTEGSEFHPDLDTASFRAVFRKGFHREMDSYSTFFENDRTTPTGLEYYLKGLGLGEVYLAGLATDFCVYFSAVDAARIGFHVSVIEDACRGIDTPPGSLAAKMDEMRSAGVRLLQSGDVLR
jgi:nicotinamidase/pyrazinamidase